MRELVSNAISNAFACCKIMFVFHQMYLQNVVYTLEDYDHMSKFMGGEIPGSPPV